MVIIIIIGLLIVAVWGFMQLPQFGKAPAGARLQKIEASPYYRDGAFQNLEHTPSLAEGVSYTTVFRKFFFGKSKRIKPASPLPSKKTDLHTLTGDALVWFGHSSYFMQLGGMKILVDPVFSGNASPISGTTRSFAGADVYPAADMPEVDILFITHDHYDHLDHKTVTALRPKVKRVITALGAGAHLEYWGYDPAVITELDWNEEINIGNGARVNTAPARHFSGRCFKRNGTIWLSFILTTPQWKIYLGGDSGYGTHFKEIGDRFGPFDLAILEDGQYNPYWKYIHMMPEEVVQAAIDLKAKKLLPVHWGKFALSLHDWDDPIIRVTAESRIKNMPLLHPLIGEAIDLNDPHTPDEWWKHVQ